MFEGYYVATKLGVVYKAVRRARSRPQTFRATAALGQIEFVATQLLRSSGPGASGDGSADNTRGSAPDRGDGPNSGPATAAATPG
jgi:hypothetical protein